MGLHESSAAAGVLQKGLKDMGEAVKVHQEALCVVAGEHCQATAEIGVELAQKRPLPALGGGVEEEVGNWDRLWQLETSDGSGVGLGFVRVFGGQCPWARRSVIGGQRGVTPQAEGGVGSVPARCTAQ